jgi:hypothetical protein
MTRNQLYAIALAEDVGRGRADPDRLPDEDWQLLLLAAGVNNACARPSVVCDRVLERARGRRDYFDTPKGSDAFSALGQGWDMKHDSRDAPWTLPSVPSAAELPDRFTANGLS